MVHWGDLSLEILERVFTFAIDSFCNNAGNCKCNGRLSRGGQGDMVVAVFGALLNGPARVCRGWLLTLGLDSLWNYGHERLRRRCNICSRSIREYEFARTWEFLSPSEAAECARRLAEVEPTFDSQIESCPRRHQELLSWRDQVLITCVRSDWLFQACSPAANSDTSSEISGTLLLITMLDEASKSWRAFVICQCLFRQAVRAMVNSPDFDPSTLAADGVWMAICATEPLTRHALAALQQLPDPDAPLVRSFIGNLEDVRSTWEWRHLCLSSVDQLRPTSADQYRSALTRVLVLVERIGMQGSTVRSVENTLQDLVADFSKFASQRGFVVGPPANLVDELHAWWNQSGNSFVGTYDATQGPLSTALQQTCSEAIAVGIGRLSFEPHAMQAAISGCISATILTRSGIPITLCAIFVLMMISLGVENVDILAYFPYQVLARYFSDNAPVLVNAYSSLSTVGSENSARRLAESYGLEVDDELWSRFSTPSHPVTVGTRMLRNLLRLCVLPNSKELMVAFFIGVVGTPFEPELDFRDVARHLIICRDNFASSISGVDQCDSIRAKHDMLVLTLVQRLVRSRRFADAKDLGKILEW